MIPQLKPLRFRVQPQKFAAQCISLIRALTSPVKCRKGPGRAAPQNRGQLPRQVGRLADKAGFSPGRARYDVGTHDIIGWSPSRAILADAPYPVKVLPWCVAWQTAREKNLQMSSHHFAYRS
ncbi:hypothetical protein OOU_Y34scaffold01092g10 [Pyricularia oryzae Y34]|uniref:Uncharacterized protein n=2 Tax=Pyricularia oryzae TaxID=318829 RepID=A0AA97NLW1_PYRO3|nr:hypothetical protein OOU_Y34scaffold01092g10 [Pyricularia oryzae Y34]KAI6261533.1 hypothetical protein MCOR19_002227 [Pyricularia oryzae]KAI6415124.1 hypothetical protein MCOR21_011510 [Pyricularia oryzae]